MTKTRSCIYCGAAGPLTREDIIPRWLLKEIRIRGLSAVPPEATPYEYVYADRKETEPFVASSPTGEIVAKHVCGSCNNGWMSELQSDFSGVFNRIANGHVKGMAHRDLDVMRRWTLMTAISVAYQKQAGGDLVLFTAETRATLVEGHTPDFTDVQMMPVPKQLTSTGYYMQALPYDPHAYATFIGIHVGPLMFAVRHSPIVSDFAHLVHATDPRLVGWIPLNSHPLAGPRHPFKMVETREDLEAVFHTPIPGFEDPSEG